VCTGTEPPFLNGDLRLAGGLSGFEGRVEMFQQGAWGTVCDDGWDVADAEVVCRQLGFADGAVSATTQAIFGEGSGSIFLDDVACAGDEARLTDCDSRELFSHNCG